MCKYEWLLCPIYGNKTRMKISEDTEIKNCPLFCPKCKHETLINVKKLNITVVKDPDAKPMTCDLYHCCRLFIF